MIYIYSWPDTNRLTRNHALGKQIRLTTFFFFPIRKMQDIGHWKNEKHFGLSASALFRNFVWHWCDSEKQNGKGKTHSRRRSYFLLSNQTLLLLQYSYIHVTESKCLRISAPVILPVITETLPPPPSKLVSFRCHTFPPVDIPIMAVIRYAFPHVRKCHHATLIHLF